jgi:hypothetical protein
MNRLNRRDFLSTSAFASAGLIAGMRPAIAADAEIEITVQASLPVGRLQFAATGRDFIAAAG